MPRRALSGDLAEDVAGHEARAAGVVVVVEAADDFAGALRGELQEELHLNASIVPYYPKFSYNGLIDPDDLINYLRMEMN